ncbi:hypothetical protein PtrSN002B_010989 [Pyrenophora tritici-repentis]|uniref:Uncharacterized protein n=1 Tax=Pyrenophora tritici-repentis TaxID=45151 RepID=A0A2W1D5Z5_9PLEO|nr:hypothetical protein PtrV1_05988 [Pyrenophora tritici-repentis]KAF7450729.1 hypothetical protein A1F99_053450 [Pyrenophora tritici-repentis]KAF7573370.1 hypothetical protein PtrM4_082750 [Pyrenophora tritici-repentis]KAI1516311.1 hypothetical protein Ptr86124_004848 [Pyrenophora tritici-repentis]KAI1524500.1 hypothetical protein PtrSN001A_010832 [Pyrenophora tritici-repentis]
MRSTIFTIGITAFLSTFAVAAPTPSTDAAAKRMPTPEQFEALAPAEKRKVYTAWYRATNIIGASDDD